MRVIKIIEYWLVLQLNFTKYITLKYLDSKILYILNELINFRKLDAPIKTRSSKWKFCLCYPIDVQEWEYFISR